MKSMHEIAVILVPQIMQGEMTEGLRRELAEELLAQASEREAMSRRLRRIQQEVGSWAETCE